MVVSIGASHDGTVWKHVDVHMGALAVEANRPDHRWHRTADHHLDTNKITNVIKIINKRNNLESTN